MLKSIKNTDEMREEIHGAFIDSDDGFTHHDALPVFEHGQWFINCGPCGAQWSVVDSNSSSGFDFERITDGDESCRPNEEEYDDSLEEEDLNAD